MSDLTRAQKRVLHHCPDCGHLLASHDGAGCASCANDGDECRTALSSVETSYESVAVLLAANAPAVPPGPCNHDAGITWPGHATTTRCELLAGHAGAHTCTRPWGGEAIWEERVPTPVEAVTRATSYAGLINDHEWLPGDPDTAHSAHRGADGDGGFHALCAVCRGDVSSIASLLAAVVAS